MLISKKPAVQIEYNPEKRRLYVEWTGYANSAVFRETLDRITEFARNNIVYSVLGNNLKQEVISKEDAEYSVSKSDELKNSEVQVLAIVIPENIFPQMIMDIIQEKSDPDFVKFFHTEAEAEQWLNQHVYVYSYPGQAKTWIQ